MSTTKKRTKFPIELLYGENPVEESILLKSMSEYDKALTAKVKKGMANRQEMERYLLNVYKPVRDLLGNNREVENSVKGIRDLFFRQRRSRILMPAESKEEQRIFTGSIGAKNVAPYKFDWTWDHKEGTAYKNSVKADKKNGHLNINIVTGDDDASNIDVKAAVGIYFRPMVENGILKVWSNPSYSAQWGTYCVSDSAHSSAFLGLKIDKYNHTSGQYSSTLVKQKKVLWTDDSWWTGTGTMNEFDSSYPLHTEVEVDRDHFYIIYVRCGARVSAAGYKVFWGSGAIVQLAVRVPSIHWELF